MSVDVTGILVQDGQSATSNAQCSTRDMAGYEGQLRS